jgi:thiamine transport system permease protein
MGRAVAQARAGLSSRTGWSAAALLPLAFLALFFAWPVLAIVSLGLREGGVLSALADSDTWELVGFTLGQALASTVVAVLAGMPLAFVLARCRIRGLGLIRAAVLQRRRGRADRRRAVGAHGSTR